MLFKNAIVYRIVGDIPVTEEEIQAALTPYAFKPASAMAIESAGWISPLDDESEYLVRTLQSCHLITMKVERKVLPSKVVLAELKTRLAEKGLVGKISKKQRGAIIDEIWADLLPKAFSQYKTLHGYIDRLRQEIVVGTGNSNQADAFLDVLRHSFGSLAVTCLQCDTAPQVVMTNWVQYRDPPPATKFGADIVLEDPAGGGRGTFRRQDLSTDEIKECIVYNKRVQRLTLLWNDTIHFEVDETLVLRKLAPTDMYLSENEEEVEDAEHNLDVKLILTVNLMRELLPRIFEWFSVAVDDIDGDQAAVQIEYNPSSHIDPDEPDPEMFDPPPEIAPEPISPEVHHAEAAA